jgi:hypothetical protein
VGPDRLDAVGLVTTPLRTCQGRSQIKSVSPFVRSRWSISSVRSRYEHLTK